MNSQKYVLIYSIAAALSATSAFADPPVPPQEMAAPSHPPAPQFRAKPTPAVVAVEPDDEPTSYSVANSASNARSPLSATIVSPDSSTLSAPISVSYSGSSPVMQITNSGTNKGVYSITSNAGNGSSAVYGTTNGSGAGVTGYNTGTKGPAGKFYITDSSSSQPAIFSTTNGKGSAIQATITTANSSEPAILGQNLTTPAYGVGVEGQGNDYGLYGNSTYTGVYGYGSDYGVIAESSTGVGLYASSTSSDALYAYSSSGGGAYIASGTGTGVFGYSDTSYGVSAESYSGTALHAKADETGIAISAQSNSGIAVYASSTSSYGVWGQSTNQFGVIGEDAGTGIGVYGYSKSGYAGYFDGKVGATSYITVSDRNAKTHFQAIDGKSILAKVTSLPVSSWVFKSDPTKKHVGPMAQDFHAAFGLDGADDKHINLTDIAGISLASIQELSKQMKQKDAQIADLKQQLSAQTQTLAQMTSLAQTVAARMTVLEEQQKKFSSGVQTVGLKKGVEPLGE